jgi:hypothetical protein
VRRAVWGLLLAAGCYRPAPAPGAPCPTGACPEGQSCSNGFCIVGDAEPPPFPPGPHLVPSNGVTVDLLIGATADVTGIDLSFDTDTGEIDDENGDTLREPGEGIHAGIGFAIRNGMAIFTAHAFAIDVDSTWDADGDNALVLFAADAVTVDGVLDVGASDEFAGVGGGDGATGGAQSSACSGGDGRFKMAINASAGGGGGGGATAGGAGAQTAADANGATAGGAGGTACSPPSALPLAGGNGGGAAGSENGNVQGGFGGGGGGAVALVAMTRVVVAGAVAAGGGGGCTDPGANGGGGGGSGGAVFLESPDVTMSGAVTANGGGGGPPGNSGVFDECGDSGHLDDAQPAAGGAFDTKAGGNGGAGAISPTDGQTLTGGAGGGGAAGAIHIRSATSQISGITSPTAETSQATIE